MTAPEQEWIRDYARLALRVNRRLTESTGGTLLIYRGPAEWSEEAAKEPLPPPGRLIEDADRLLDAVPFDPRRAAYLSAHVRAVRAVARRLNGERVPLREYARECLGIEPDMLPESVFEEAHARLDAALPKGGGTLSDRLHAWQRRHTLDQIERLPGLVAKAVQECRARTRAIIPLPDDEVVGCRLIPDAPYLAAGHYEGGTRSTIFMNRAPFNLADLLYTVAHEGHPGHIAESMLKERRLVEEEGRLEQQIRFMLAPSFVISEGIGLHAQHVIFPGDEAQAWLTDNILRQEGIEPDGSDFAAIHDVKTVLWGVWSNAAFLADEGRPESEIGAYLTRWALLGEDEIAAFFKVLSAPGMNAYVLGYYHGWRILRPWLDAPGRHDRVRRLLTEQILPADIEQADRPAT